LSRAVSPPENRKHPAGLVFLSVKKRAIIACGREGAAPCPHPYRSHSVEARLRTLADFHLSQLSSYAKQVADHRPCQLAEAEAHPSWYTQSLAFSVLQAHRQLRLPVPLPWRPASPPDFPASTAASQYLADCTLVDVEAPCQFGIGPADLPQHYCHFLIRHYGKTLTFARATHSRRRACPSRRTWLVIAASRATHHT
jgi:hypothetical protein